MRKVKMFSLIATYALIALSVHVASATEQPAKVSPNTVADLLRSYELRERAYENIYVECEHTESTCGLHVINSSPALFTYHRENNRVMWKEVSYPGVKRRTVQSGFFDGERYLFLDEISRTARISENMKRGAVPAPCLGYYNYLMFNEISMLRGHFLATSNTLFVDPRNPDLIVSNVPAGTSIRASQKHQFFPVAQYAQGYPGYKPGEVPLAELTFDMEASWISYGDGLLFPPKGHLRSGRNTKPDDVFAEYDFVIRKIESPSKKSWDYRLTIPKGYSVIDEIIPDSYIQK